MKIVGNENMDDREIDLAIRRGAKFVIFEYAISILILTFKQPSNIHFVRAGESTFSKGLIYSVITFFFGWWGFPWGPIYSIMALSTNFKGGKDVTQEILQSVQQD